MQFKTYKLGTQVSQNFEGMPALFNDFQWGCVGWFAKPRYGKSAIAKHVFVHIVNNEPGRRYIIFDMASNVFPKGEWYSNIRYPNFESSCPMSCPEIYPICDFTMKISELTEFEWELLGFTDKSSKIMHRIAKEGRKYHKDEPETFLDLLNYLPFGSKNVSDLNDWNESFPDLKLYKPLHSMVPQSIVNNFQMMADFFWSKKKKRGYIHDWGKLLKEHRVIAFMPDYSVSFKNWRGHCVGFILRKLESHMISYRPLIVFEDSADSLCGNETKTYLNSTFWILQYIKKLPKQGSHIWVLSQNDGDLHPEFIQNLTAAIIGHMENSPNFASLAESVYYDLAADYREFFYINKEKKSRGIKFVPVLSCCNTKTQI